MRRLPHLAVFASILLRVFNFLTDNFERLKTSLREQCPEASDVWLADMVVTSAIEGAFTIRREIMEK